MRWKVASDLRFRAAISEPKTPSFCGIYGDLAPSTRKSLAIAIVRFWCTKPLILTESHSTSSHLGSSYPMSSSMCVHAFPVLLYRQSVAQSATPLPSFLVAERTPYTEDTTNFSTVLNGSTILNNPSFKIRKGAQVFILLLQIWAIKIASNVARSFRGLSVLCSLGKADHWKCTRNRCHSFTASFRGKSEEKFTKVLWRARRNTTQFYAGSGLPQGRF